MIEESSRFQLNSPTVVCDVVDGEVVLVDLESGAYYSTEQVGATIWQYLQQGRSVGEMITALSAHYIADRREIEQNVHDLIGQLLNEGLVVADHSPSPATQTDPVTGPTQFEKAAFSSVVLHKFSDMEDLLLLDPVHEVNDIGWPHASKQ